MKYHGLGKGLGALISKKENQSGSEPQLPAGIVAPVKSDAVFYIETDKINPNPDQPRKDFDESHIKDLANSIREHGILQPLVVTKEEKVSPTGINVSYRLIAGERRLRAAKLAGVPHVPVIVKKVTPQENFELAIIENVQRSDLNALERAIAYQRLMDEYGLSQQDVAMRVGKSRESIANLMRLLNLPKDIQDAIASGKINEGHARAILMVKDEKGQMDLFYKILNMGLNVREVENIARTAAVKMKPVVELDPNIKYMATQLEDAIGAKVSLQPKKKGGKIVIQYFNSDDLGNIIGKICGTSSQSNGQMDQSLEDIL